MKPVSQFLSVLAFALVASAAFISTARAEDTPGFPPQMEIEARQIHASHRLNCAQPAVTAIDVVINFATNSDKLSPTDQAMVKKVAAIIKSPSFKGKHVMVNGYTDNVGKDARNQRLSYHRALRVMHALVAQGVPAGMLSAQGFGKENPIASNSTAEGRLANRRVSFSVLDAE